MADAIVAHYEGPIVSLAEARSGGLLYYFTGKPCKHGHVAQRIVSGRSCVVCHHKRSAEWYADNTQLALEQSKDRYESNRSARLEQCKAYNLRHQDKIAARRERNRAKAASATKAWRIANPEWFRELRRSRRLRKRNAEGSHTGSEISALLIKQRYRCAGPHCKRHIGRGYHVDHVMPLALGGTNWISNIQLLCPTCNMKKHAKHPIEWAQQNGMLL